MKQKRRWPTHILIKNWQSDNEADCHYTAVKLDPIFAGAMLDIISIAVDLAADMPEFRRLVYTGHRPVVFRKGRGMQQYAEMMAAGDTPLLMLPSLPDAPQNVVSVNDVLLAVYPGGICWSGTHTTPQGMMVRWETYTVPPDILERVAGKAAR